MSTEYYDRNGVRFFSDSVSADLSGTQTRFLAHVPIRGEILDAGCGSGRDSLAFKNAGYSVAAFDGSVRMVQLASEHVGIPVRHLLFENVDWVNQFDGVWACACLLHVPRTALDGVMARLVRTLKPGGAFFMSFKYGANERFANERHFTDMNEELLASAVVRAGLGLADMWTQSDARPGRSHEMWISAIAK